MAHILNQLETHQDWLSFTAPVAETQSLMRYLSKWLGTCESLSQGMPFYPNAVKWSAGARLGWHPEKHECMVSVNGDSCDRIPVDEKVAFFRGLQAFTVKCTRLDAAVDVPTSWLSMDVVHAAAGAGQVLGFSRYDPRRPVADMRTGELEGDSANFGRRGSDGSGKYVRIYDKGLETRKDYVCIRIEAELSGDRARAAFLKLCQAEDAIQFSRVVGELAGGSIDFVDRDGSHGHRERCKRLTWWQRIIDQIGSAIISVRRVKPELQETMEYFKRNWRKPFAKFVHALDATGHCVDIAVGMFINQIVEAGDRDLGVRGRQIARETTLDVVALLAVGS